MFGFVCWRGNISKLDTGRMEKIVKKKIRSCYGKATGQEKRQYRKLMQILNDPTHPMRHYFDSRILTGVEDFYFTSMNKYKPL